MKREDRIRLGDGCERRIVSRGRPPFKPAKPTGVPDRLLALNGRIG